MRTSELYPLQGRGRPTLWKGTREALAYIRTSRPTMVLIGMAIVLVSISFNYNVFLPVLAKQTLDAGPRTFGILSTCFGIGALLGALTSATFSSTRWRLLFAGALGTGFAELAIAPLHNVVAVGLLLGVCGVCFTTYAAIANTTIQLASPDHIRGRVLGIYFYAWMGPVPLAAPFLGWLMSTGGTRLAFEVAGVCALAVTAISAFIVLHPPKTRSAVESQPAERQQIAASRPSR
jgi:MFS family permease